MHIPAELAPDLFIPMPEPIVQTCQIAKSLSNTNKFQGELFYDKLMVYNANIVTRLSVPNLNDVINKSCKK